MHVKRKRSHSQVIRPIWRRWSRFC